MNTSNAEIKPAVSPLALHAETLSRTASHESGHAVTDTIQGIQVTRVSITPLPGCYRGCCDILHSPQHAVTANQWDQYQRKTIISLLAGPFATFEFGGKTDLLDMGDRDDARKVINLVKSLYPNAPEADTRRFLGNMSLISHRLLRDPVAWQAVSAVSAALLEYKTLSAPMLKAILHEALPTADRARLADFTARKINFLRAAMSAVGTKESA